MHSGIEQNDSALVRWLDPVVQDHLLAAALALRRDGPVPITFATARFTCLIDNWFEHLARAGVGRALLVALDETTAAHQAPPGCSIVRAASHAAKANFWQFRLQVFALLACWGIDFVHSDLDAVWLEDSRSECFADPAMDLVFSQGTYHPQQAFLAWGFVLCCGLFAVRARPATARFLAAAWERAQIEPDDQAAINLVLADSDLIWQRNHQKHYSIDFAGRSFSAYRDILKGTSAQFGLCVGLLPYHRVPRLPSEAAGAAVKHPSSPRDPAAKIPILRQCGCWLGRRPERPQILVFSYHKSGTTLLDQVMRKLAERLGLTVQVQYGMAYHINRDADIVLLPHSLLGFEIARPFRAVRIIRDPRDIWVSSYLYHLRTSEGWCTNTNFDPTPPISYPRVDFSMLHRPERWKRRWLSRLSGKSYQENLRDRDFEASLMFELEGYTGCTLEAMRAWRAPTGVLDVKLEDIAKDFDSAMAEVFRHLGLTETECELGCQVAAQEDVQRMDDAAIAANPHIYSRTLSKWRDTLPEGLIRRFEKQHGDLLRSMGYVLSTSAE